MPELNGTQALPELVRTAPRVKVVMFSSDPGLKSGQGAVAAGAHAYFTKDEPIGDLLDAVVALVT